MIDDLQMTPEERDLHARCDKAIQRYFSEIITDPNICAYIFGTRQYKLKLKRRNPANLASYMNNILSLAFVFAFGCLRVDAALDTASAQSAARNHNSLRVITSLKKAFVQCPVTSDLIEFVLSDIQFVMQQNSGSDSLQSVFSQLWHFDNRSSFSLAKCYKVIKEWRVSPDRFTMKSSEASSLFLALLRCMTFLQNYTLVEENNDYIFRLKDDVFFDDADADYASVPACHLLHFDGTAFYTLFSVDPGINDRQEPLLSLRYQSTDGFFSRVLNVDGSGDPEDPTAIVAMPRLYYLEITGRDYWQGGVANDNGGNDSGNFIDLVHTINYKYIKNLALALSDAISVHPGLKNVLYEAFQAQYPEIFSLMPPAVKQSASLFLGPKKTKINWEEMPTIEWDSIIVMLLIEASPTKVLEVLIRNDDNRSFFHDVSVNLCKRVDNSKMPIYGLSREMLNAAAEERVRKNLIVDESGVFGRTIRHATGNHLFAKAAAAMILESLTVDQSDSIRARKICVGNIAENIQLLNRIRSDVPPAERAEFVSCILGETFRHLLCFYRGVLAYGKKKVRYDSAFSSHCASTEDISAAQNDLRECFMEAAKDEFERLKPFNSAIPAQTIDLICEFQALCNECASQDPNNKVARNLYVSLGKYEIVAGTEFERYLRDYSESFRVVTDQNVGAWADFALALLKFLKHGFFEKSATSDNVSMSRKISMNAVYPFTATFNKGEENYDGYKTVTFSLNIDWNHDGITDYSEDIKVLTEFSYPTSEVFYCLPNVLRSNRRWWIDPLLISFKEFNDIFPNS